MFRRKAPQESPESLNGQKGVKGLMGKISKAQP
jgi:hypothetical protein